jgi:hypothetical protein
METNIDFDEHVHRTSGGSESCRPGTRHVHVIDDERQRRAFEQGDHARSVDGIDRVRQPDIGESRIGKDFGFAKLGAADTNGTAVDLPAGNHRTLVRFRVWAQPNAAAIGRFLHTIDIGEYPRLLDQNSGGRQVVKGHEECYQLSTIGRISSDSIGPPKPGES